VQVNRNALDCQYGSFKKTKHSKFLTKEAPKMAPDKAYNQKN
jgi:hypothetical protein